MGNNNNLVTSCNCPNEVADLPGGRPWKYEAPHIALDNNDADRFMAANPMKHCKFVHALINEEEPFVQFREMVKMPLKTKRAMEEEDGIVDSDVARIRIMTLETLLSNNWARGEGIRLQFLEGNPGGLRLTLRQIKAATRAAMTGLEHDYFMMTFKRGDRFIMPCKADNPCFAGDENHCHVANGPERLQRLQFPDLETLSLGPEVVLVFLVEFHCLLVILEWLRDTLPHVHE